MGRDRETQDDLFGKARKAFRGFTNPDYPESAVGPGLFRRSVFSKNSTKLVRCDDAERNGSLVFQKVSVSGDQELTFAGGRGLEEDLIVGVATGFEVHPSNP